MRSTQILVWEIQYLNTLCLYQDTVELQETRLPAIMDTSSAQVIWTMMFTVEMEIVHFSIEEDCHDSNLNGFYHGTRASYADGVVWRAWRGYSYSLKFTEMKLREN